VPASDIGVYPDHPVKIGSSWGFPVREDVAFTDLYGVDKSVPRRRMRRVIQRLQVPLRKILEPGEVIFFGVRGKIMPGKLQRYTQGTQSHFLAPGALVFTNRRFLHLSVKWNGRWNRGVRSAHWSDIKEGHVTGLLRGKLHLEYRQGKRETYWRIPGSAAKKIQLLLKVLLPASAVETKAAPSSIASLCPECLSPLTSGIFQCAQCRLKFKDGKNLWLHALMVPGGAYFYVGYNLFGLAHAFVDVAIFVSMILWGLATFGLVHPHVRLGAPANRSTYAILAAFLASALVFDVCMSVKVARGAIRDFIPDSC
jgi:hypothetical protein